MRIPFFSKKRTRVVEIDPDEIFLDSRNLPEFNTAQMEGRLETPIRKQAFLIVGSGAVLILLALVGRLSILQIAEGSTYKERSEQNRLEESTVFARRGVLYDRRGTELAWNTRDTPEPFASRSYIDAAGFGHILGYITLPKKDSSGKFYEVEYKGVAGTERSFNDQLSGENGKRMIEVDAHGAVHSESVLTPPRDGGNVTLSIDARVEEAFYGFIKGLADQVPFTGGAGAIMDVRTGELIALTSYPEYRPSVMSSADDRAAVQEYMSDTRKPFLDRMVSGLYTPGSIVKPFMALGALQEGVISPEKQIYSAGYITVPNPYDPSRPSRFNDWKAHGWVDMRDAIAVSSDVYFYEIGGGFPGQQGMGIANVEKYARLFGIASPTGIQLPGEESGTIPNPEWKKKMFDGEDWRVGDTYNTVIGQYGFQVTPIQMLRAIASIANGGTLLTPSLIASTTQTGTKVDIPAEDFKVVQEGMRQGVLMGTGVGLNKDSIHVASKTGTAQLGRDKQHVNSWATGFFPYEHPRYAFIVLMERGPVTNTLGGVYVMRQLLDWMAVHTPEYLEG